jgi:integrase
MQRPRPAYVLDATRCARPRSRSGTPAAFPTRGVRLPSVPAIRRHVPTPDELVALANAHPAEYEAMVWLGAVLGLRWGEVAGLRVGRLDVLRATLDVAEEITRGRKGRVLTDAPKSEAAGVRSPFRGR